jgi:membrane protease YdiL (CAAX protease family)
MVMIIFHKNPMVFLRNPLPVTGPDITLFFAVGGLIAPAAEEIVFRGLVYGYLRRWGVAAGLVGTTLLFAAAHMASGIPLTQIVGGLVFALAYEKEKNLMVPVVIHVLGNLAIFSLSLIC